MREGRQKEGHCMCAQGAFVVKLEKSKRGNLFAVNYMLLKNNKDLCKICN